MRRKLAYILLSAAVLFGGAATIASTITSLDTDVTYGTGRALYFRVSEEGTTLNGVYPENYVEEDGYQAVDLVAEEMESRLSHWGIEGTVEKEGYSTVKVTIQAIQEPPVEYTSIGELWNDFFVDKTITTGTYVTVTGYVTGVNKSRQNVYIQTDEYAVQLYKADAYSALFTEGNLITATGSITNYYGLELEDISSVVA